MRNPLLAPIRRWVQCLTLSFVMAGGLATHAAGADRIAFDPQRMTLAVADEKGARTLIGGIAYRASFSATEPALETDGVASVDTVRPGVVQVKFRLKGPAAAQSSVTCEVDQSVFRRTRLTWRIVYNGPERAFFPWTAGLQFQLPQRVSQARPKPMLKWVAPTGKESWEVAGDAPYPVLDRFLREIKTGNDRLVVATSWYDGDWFYSRNLDRVTSIGLCVPSKKPQQITATTDLVLAGPDDSDDDLLAIAQGEPVSVQVETGRLANLFAPGETLRLVARGRNVNSQPASANFAWGLYDYSGKTVASGDRRFTLTPGSAWNQELAPDVVARPGIYFLAGKLTWPEGERLIRTTVGVLPERSPSLRPESPFGMAGIICAPHIYPDQPEMETVLKLCARIGVHWVRGLGFPVQQSPPADEIAAARRRLELFHRYGIEPHVQCGCEMPRDDEASRRFQTAFSASLPAYQFLSRHVEVGNELNFSTKAEDYVRRLLKPQHDVMRKLYPQGKVMNMGLGGVATGWWDDFVKAEGLNYVDIVSVHPGHHPKAPEFWEGWDGWVYRSQMLRVFDTLDKRNLRGQREVWITEAYAPSTPERSQLDPRTAADYLVREYCLSLALGVRVVEWYQLQDGTWYATAPNPLDGEHSYGMLYTDLAPKPQFVAYGVMTSQLEGARCLGRLNLGADDLYGIRFQKGAEKIDVLWSYREKHECDIAWWPPESFKNRHRRPDEPWRERWRQPVGVALPAQGPVEVTDLMGNSRRLETNSGRIELSLTGSPLYVRNLGDIPLQPQVWPQPKP